ncbi:MAG: hypothetical protein ACP5G0_03345 [Desulfomonilia bacterium]
MDEKKEHEAINPGLLQVCTRWSSEMRVLSENHARVAYMESELPKLLADTEVFTEILTGIADTMNYPGIRTPTMFDTEIVLYRDPDRIFSVRMYLWGPGDYDPIHDHNSWGVIGSVSGGLDVINYKRLDKDRAEIHAEIVEFSREVIPPGRTYTVMPLEEGIHRTGNPGLYTIIQVGVYGENLTGRRYIHLFHESDGRVVRLYSPQVKKQLLAREALRLLGENSRTPAD